MGDRLTKEGPEGLTLYLRHGQVAVAMDLEVYAPSSPEAASKKGTINRYVLSGDLLAGRISQVVKLDGTRETTKSYYHLDHLNSTKTVSDGEGKLEVSYVYRAFGEQLRRLGQGEAKYSYGGKELDSATNLYYFNARFYDATTGRFINVDPVQDGTNWYSYCSNNPLGMVDPTGLITEFQAYHSFWNAVDKFTKEGFGFAVSNAEDSSKSTKSLNVEAKGNISSRGAEIEGSAVAASTSGNVVKDTFLGIPFSVDAGVDTFKASAREALGTKGVAFGGEVKMIEWTFDIKIGPLNVGATVSLGSLGAQVNAEITNSKADLSVAADLGIGLELRAGINTNEDK